MAVMIGDHNEFVEKFVEIFLHTTKFGPIGECEKK